MLLNIAMEKQNVISMYHGILLISKKEQTTHICSNLDHSQGHSPEWEKKKKPVSKGHMLYKPIYITFLKQSYREEELTNGCQGLMNKAARGKGFGYGHKWVAQCESW